MSEEIKNMNANMGQKIDNINTNISDLSNKMDDMNDKIDKLLNDDKAEKSSEERNIKDKSIQTGSGDVNNSGN